MAKTDVVESAGIEEPDPECREFARFFRVEEEEVIRFRNDVGEIVGGGGKGAE